MLNKKKCQSLNWITNDGKHPDCNQTSPLEEASKNGCNSGDFRVCKDLIAKCSPLGKNNYRFILRIEQGLTNQKTSTVALRTILE